MAEVLVQVDTPVAGMDGTEYTARICGREADDGLWDGWIEFEPASGPVLRSPRETRQPNRADLDYWAGGLTVSYLEGALQRALRPETPDLRPRQVSGRPTYDGPAPSRPAAPPARPPGVASRAVLDPYEAYAAHGEDTLRHELSALDEDHLRNIARSYHMAPRDDADLRTFPRSTLAELIVDTVKKSGGTRPRAAG